MTTTHVPPLITYHPLLPLHFQPVGPRPWKYQARALSLSALSLALVKMDVAVKLAQDPQGRFISVPYRIELIKHLSLLVLLLAVLQQ